MARILNEEEISGIAPSNTGKPAMMAVGRTLSEEQITGRGDLENQVAELNTLWGATKDIVGGIAKRTGSLLTSTGDLIVGVPGAIAGHLMNVGTRLYGTAKGERADIVGQAGQLAENLGTLKVPGTKLEIPLEPLKTPLSSLFKMATGVEPWDQSGVEHLMESVSEKISKFSGNRMTKEDVLLGIGVAMDAAGAKGGQMAAKGIADTLIARQKAKSAPPPPLKPTPLTPEEAPKTPRSDVIEVTTSAQVKEIFANAKKAGTVDPVTALFNKAKQGKLPPVEEKLAKGTSEAEARAASAWMDDPKIQAAAEVEPWKRTPQQQRTLDTWLKSWNVNPAALSVAGIAGGVGLIQWLQGEDSDTLALAGLATTTISKGKLSEIKAPESHPFIGYLAKNGKTEFFPETEAKAADYHHSHLVKDMDAYDQDSTLRFVRMSSENKYTIAGDAAIDPFESTQNVKQIQTLARKLIDAGADPQAPIIVEDMALPKVEAPYQGKAIGTLQKFAGHDYKPAAAAIGTGLLLADEQDEFTALAAGLAGATVGKKGGKWSGVAEPKLIEGMKAGEQGAFTEMYRKTQGQATRTAASFGDAADDIVQRSYEKAFRAVAKGDFRGDAKFSTFLHRIIQNEGKNRYAFEQRRPTESLDQNVGPEGRPLEETIGHQETPEAAALNARLAERMQSAMDRLPENFRKPFEMYELEGKPYEEIAQELGIPVNTVKTQIHRARERLQEQLKDYNNLQAGYADRRLLTGIAAVGIGATVGAVLDPENPLRASVYGALTGGALGTGAGRSALKALIKSPDAALGLISTRLGNISPDLKFALRNHELRVLRGIDTANDAVLPFLQSLKKLSKDESGIAAKALLNGDADALQQFPSLRATLPAVQRLLGSIESQLKGLNRFGEGVVNYFPRLVKDFEGLKNAIGQQAKVGLEKVLVDAEAKMIRKEGRSLTDVEESIITNRYLFGDDVGSFQPGWAKGRKIKEIPQALLEYYEQPAESLLRYVSGAINDIETARFFGRDLAAKTKGKKAFTDVDSSIGNLTARLLKEGKISQPQAMEIRDILKARFEGGNKGMNTILSNIRNATNISLLGNIASAATQIGDSGMNIYHHGLVPTLQAVTERIIGKQRITPKDLGLINHVAEELSDMQASGRALHTAMKFSAFHAIDMFAKGTGLNAALIKAQRLLQTPEGAAKFRAKYQDAFGDGVNQVIQDLKNGRRTPDTDLYAFSELSDTQPISKAEMPEMYLANPNGRILYQLKTYMLKQTDIVRRDAYQEIAKGTPEGIMRGVKNLAALGTIYALANVPGDVVKDLLAGRDIDPLSTPRLVENIFQTFGINRYAGEQIGQGKVVETATGMATPPVRVLQDIAKLNEKSLSYVPLAGRTLYDRFGGGNERKEIYEKRLENRGKKGAERKSLSPEAKMYLRRKRMEEKLKKANQ